MIYLGVTFKREVVQITHGKEKGTCLKTCLINIGINGMADILHCHSLKKPSNLAFLSL